MPTGAQARFFPKKNEVPRARLDAREKVLALISELAFPLLLIAHAQRVGADALHVATLLLLLSILRAPVFSLNDQIRSAATRGVLGLLFLTPPSLTHTHYLHAVRDPSWSSALACISRAYLYNYIIAPDENAAYLSHVAARVVQKSPLRSLGVFPPNARFLSSISDAILLLDVVSPTPNVIVKWIACFSIVVVDQVLLYKCLRFCMYSLYFGIRCPLLFIWDPSAALSALWSWAFDPTFSLAFVVIALVCMIAVLFSAALIIAKPAVLSVVTGVTILLTLKAKMIVLEFRDWAVATFVRWHVTRQEALHILSSVLLHTLAFFAPLPFHSICVLFIADLLIRAVAVPSVCIEPAEFNAACHSGSQSEALTASRWNAVLLAADAGGSFSVDSTCSICFEMIDAPSTVAVGLGVPRPAAPEFRLWRDTAKDLRDTHAPLRPWMESRYELVLTSCGHVFHSRCLAGWEVALAMRQQLPPTSCAICRASYASSRVQLLRRRTAVTVSDAKDAGKG